MITNIHPLALIGLFETAELIDVYKINTRAGAVELIVIDGKLYNITTEV